MVYAIVFGALAVILIIWFIAAYNKFAHTKIKVQEAESGIDVALTKRYDVLVKEMEVVKGYAKHEASTLSEVIKMRKGMPIEEKVDALKSMDSMQSRINMLAESYPQIRANENFKQLQLTVRDVEEHLQAARRAYNANVTIFNKLVVSFPSLILAKLFGYRAFAFFVAEDAKREDVKMEF